MRGNQTPDVTWKDYFVHCTDLTVVLAHVYCDIAASAGQLTLSISVGWNSSWALTCKNKTTLVHFYIKPIAEFHLDNSPDFHI